MPILYNNSFVFFARPLTRTYFTPPCPPAASGHLQDVSAGTPKVQTPVANSARREVKNSRRRAPTGGAPTSIIYCQHPAVVPSCRHPSSRSTHRVQATSWLDPWRWPAPSDRVPIPGAPIFFYNSFCNTASHFLTTGRPGLGPGRPPWGSS